MENPLRAENKNSDIERLIGKLPFGQKTIEFYSLKTETAIE